MELFARVTKANGVTKATMLANMQHILLNKSGKLFNQSVGIHISQTLDIGLVSC